MDNTVTLVGNCTRDPELRFTPAGMGVAGFGLAVNRVWTDRQSGEKKEQVSFIDITAWGTLGENVAASISKGSRVIVTGRLEQQSWEKDGNKHSKIQVVADEVAPSLRWATVEVHRNERTEGGGGSSKPSQAQRPAPEQFNEEPF